jgi:uncharacterized protein (TIGR03083 family)
MAQSADTTLPNQVAVLSASTDRLAALVETLTPEDVRRQAYPTEWTVADVLSHLGSGAVITRRRLDGEVDMQAIWDEWNAKDPDEKAADALKADRELQDRLASLTADDQARLRFTMGPMDLDLTTFLGMRINEHSVHTWDVAVTFDPTAVIPSDATALVLETLGMMAPFAGKPTGADRTITVRTSAPTRQLEIVLRPDSVAIRPCVPVGRPDLEMSADALVRLVYGRLDPEHSPSFVGNRADLEALTEAFPGL